MLKTQIYDLKYNSRKIVFYLKKKVIKICSVAYIDKIFERGGGNGNKMLANIGILLATIGMVLLVNIGVEASNGFWSPYFFFWHKTGLHKMPINNICKLLIYLNFFCHDVFPLKTTPNKFVSFDAAAHAGFFSGEESMHFLLKILYFFTPLSFKCLCRIYLIFFYVCSILLSGFLISIK